MEILALRARAVVVPFAGGVETEQMLRAQALASKGHFQLLPEAQLTPQTLAAAIDRAAGAERPPPATVNLSGAETTARFVNTMLSARLQ
jgi:predicted glycosyltransferase